jgi:hypothetical protein
MYGSSDVFDTLKFSSAFISGVSSIRPVPDTARRGDAASILSVMRSPAILMSPTIWPMPSSAANRSRMVPRTS